jgi:DNA-binding MarR family transcriptional regulator
MRGRILPGRVEGSHNGANICSRLCEVSFLYSLHIDEARVPDSILCAGDLRATEKVVWMALAMDAHLDEAFLYSPSRLARRTGMSRSTVRKAVARLLSEERFVLATVRLMNKLSEQWLPPGWLQIPVELIMATQLNPQAKVVYAVLVGKDDPEYRLRQFKYSELAELMHLSPQTVKHAVRRLAKLSWLEMEQPHKQAVIRFSLLNPIDKKHSEEVWRIQHKLDTAEYYGEALMTGICTALVDSQHYTPRIRPPFLENPDTGQRLELDLFYYLHYTAFEFNGPQHYGVTKLYSAEQVLEQQKRDQTKEQTCAEEDIELIVIQSRELSWETIKKKIGRRLPLRRDVRINRKLFRLLKPRCRRYREQAKHGWAPSGSTETPHA